MANNIPIVSLSTERFIPADWNARSIATYMAGQRECGFTDPHTVHADELLAAMGRDANNRSEIRDQDYYRLVQKKCIQSDVGLQGVINISTFRRFLISLDSAGLTLPPIWDPTPAANETLTNPQIKAKGQKIKKFIDLFDWNTLTGNSIPVDNPAVIAQAKQAVTDYMEQLDMATIDANLSASAALKKLFLFGILGNQGIHSPTIELK